MVSHLSAPSLLVFALSCASDPGSPERSRPPSRRLEEAGPGTQRVDRVHLRHISC